MTRLPCPACASTDIVSFHETAAMPVHTTLLMPTRQSALDYPRGRLQLGYCESCGFISNRLFERDVHEYSPRCEESQGHSPRFRDWLEKLGRRLVENYDIRQQTVLEIGSGKGEFLASVCRLGDNTGIGYDPAYVAGRVDGLESVRIDFHNRLWDLDCTLHGADFVACRHTLEHIPDVFSFLRDIRTAIGEKSDTLLFFEVPDILRVLNEGAFWDIYYEHCSYFSRNSLACLFQTAGFDVLESWLDYDGQYILLVARPATGETLATRADAVSEIVAGVEIFTQKFNVVNDRWSRFLRECKARQRSVMLWGGGSKAAAFLNQVDGTGVIESVIDINPNKHHAFIPGTGQEVVGPEFLLENAPDVIIAMNPVYLKEIQSQLDALNCRASLIAV